MAFVLTLIEIRTQILLKWKRKMEEHILLAISTIKEIPPGKRNVDGKGDGDACLHVCELA